MPSVGFVMPFRFQTDYCHRHLLQSCVHVCCFVLARIIWIVCAFVHPLFLDKTCNGNSSDMIKSERRRHIETAISNNVVPTRSKGAHDLMLRLGNKRYAKALHQGQSDTGWPLFILIKHKLPPSHMILREQLCSGEPANIWCRRARHAC